MMSQSDEQYWTPVDKFILNVLEKYESLAMLTPRIQTPYDLMTWDEIKFDNVKKFKYIRDIKTFYKDFLEKNTVMDFGDFIGPGSLAYDPKVDEETLMSHPPVFGHWLEESGF